MDNGLLIYSNFRPAPLRIRKKDIIISCKHRTKEMFCSHVCMRPDTLYAPGEFISRHLDFILGIAVALSSFIYLHQICAFKSLF